MTWIHVTWDTQSRTKGWRFQVYWTFIFNVFNWSLSRNRWSINTHKWRTGEMLGVADLMVWGHYGNEIIHRQKHSSGRFYPPKDAKRKPSREEVTDISSCPRSGQRELLAAEETDAPTSSGCRETLNLLQIWAQIWRRCRAHHSSVWLPTIQTVLASG